MYSSVIFGTATGKKRALSRPNYVQSDMWDEEILNELKLDMDDTTKKWRTEWSAKVTARTFQERYLCEEELYSA